MALQSVADPLPALPSTKAGAGQKSGGRSRLWWFLTRRVGAAIITLWITSLLIFICASVLPGDAVTQIIGKSGTPETIAALKQQLGLDQSLPRQYLDWIWSVLHGDFGDSAVALAQQQPDPSITSSLSDPLQSSLVLGGVTAILLVPLTLLIGVIAGVKADTKLDQFISLPTLILGGLPEFATGALLIYLFFNVLGILPPVSLVPPGQSVLDEPIVLILPVLTLLLVAVASGVRQVRLGTIEVLQTDFVQFARLNGIGERRVILRYGLRNAIANSVQTIAQNLQYLVGGIIVVESVFAYPGLGVYLVNAVLARDTSKIMAAAIILAALYTVINILADLLVIFLVPKLRTELL